MTLMRCPECGREVSDAALACPACGRPLRAEAVRSVSTDGRFGAWYEYRSERTLFGLPLVHIVYGPTGRTGLRPARGILAVGNIAIGVVAFGGIAVGAIACGGLCLGVLCLGGIALGLGFGLGGIATGYIALGGIAIGAFVLGGVQAGMQNVQVDPGISESFMKNLHR